MIIERRTALNFLREGMQALLGALAKRLNENGIFVSHCHEGAWRPPDEPHHYTKHWFEENGWAIWDGSPGVKPTGRVAWLLTTTG